MTDTRPRHEQIAADLRARIMSGDLTPGAQLPSTSQLVEQYDAAGTTIQRALVVLKAEGFLISQAGKGVYVRDYLPHHVHAGAYIAPNTGGYSYQILEVTETHPPADVAAVIGDEPTAIMRKRLMLHGGEPIELSRSYYPAAIAAGTALARRGKIPGGAPRALADLGYPQRRLVDRFSARPATTEEIDALRIPADVPVIRQFRIIYSDDDRPVEVSVLVKGSHRCEIVYDVPTE